MKQHQVNRLNEHVRCVSVAKLATSGGGGVGGGVGWGVMVVRPALLVGNAAHPHSV